MHGKTVNITHFLSEEKEVVVATEDWLTGLQLSSQERILAYRWGEHPIEKGAMVEHVQGMPLAFPDSVFALAVSIDTAFQAMPIEDIVQQLKELIRVSKQVRLVFSALDEAEVMRIWGPVMLALQAENVGVEMGSVQMAGRSVIMLRLWAQQCALS